MTIITGESTFDEDKSDNSDEFIPTEDDCSIVAIMMPEQSQSGHIYKRASLKILLEFMNRRCPGFAYTLSKRVALARVPRKGDAQWVRTNVTSRADWVAVYGKQKEDSAVEAMCRAYDANPNPDALGWDTLRREMGNLYLDTVVWENAI